MSPEECRRIQMGLGEPEGRHRRTQERPSRPKRVQEGSSQAQET